MSHDRLTFDLRITVRSPFLFRGLDGRFVGVDATHLRDEEGRPIIPADQVRGVFRQALSILSEHVGLPGGDLDEIFGRASSASEAEDAFGSNEPGRGRILFDDLVARRIVDDPEDGKAVERDYAIESVAETTRIAIDEETGAVDEGFLQVLELVAPFGAAVCFDGRFTLFDTGSRVDEWAKALGRALALITSVGALKSPGWGEVLQARSFVKKAGISSLALPREARVLPDRLRLRMRFDRPILVNARRVSGNAFEGQTVIPGGVVKGALARRLELVGLLPDEGGLGSVLAALAVGHARLESKVQGEVVDRPLPMSLVVAKVGLERRFGDACHVGLGEGAMIEGRPASFQPDWKGADFGAAAACLGRAEPWDDPALLARTHTKIDSEGGSADGQLFTTIARSVRRRVPAPDGRSSLVDRAWLLDIDLSEARSVNADLADRLVEALLTSGLDGIGRTGAGATFEFVGPVGAPRPMPVRGTSDHWVVVLESPAAMLDASTIVASDGSVQSAEDAYRAYWKRVLPEAELVNFFAAQDYRGGYLARRRRIYGQTYFPFLLTREGSVFVLRTTKLDQLARLARFGLPHFQPVDGTDVSWRNSPWVPQNGYGAVSIDHLSDVESAALCGVVESTGRVGDAA